MLPETTLEEAAALLAALRAKHLTVATAESCTGGLIAAALTAIAGSSASVLAGFVTYSNEAKTSMLGVPAEMIERHGAVSEEVARRMVEGALRASGANPALACTGVAGPGGGRLPKPVGLVFVAVSGPGRAMASSRLRFSGDREAVRQRAAAAALRLLWSRLKK